MLDNVTPVILTYNEAPNLARTLSKLAWAKDIVVVDSVSTDDTVAIASSHPAVRVVSRPFDSHANQWNFAISQTEIKTEWVLALDADYVLSDELVNELKALNPAPDFDGYEARFVYCVEGRPLRATVYPPVTVLFRAKAAKYVQDGHTQRLQVSGPIGALSKPVYHDDRKSLSRWVASQVKYARIEADKFNAPGWRPAKWTEKVRRLRLVAPFAMLGYCLFAKLLILDGWPGILFSLQRAFAELLLSLYLIQSDLTGKAE